jgi:hypothetical protein
MARNWLRHHVDAQDGQVVIRKIVMSPAVDSPAVLTDTPGDNVSMSPQQARYMVQRARTMRETRQRRTGTGRVR